jgi:hypothetical protein
MMRRLLEDFPPDQVVYVYTTEGHVHVGSVTSLVDDVVFIRAPDGRTQININLSDISTVRPLLDEPEDPLP